MDTGILSKVWELTIQAQDPNLTGFYTYEKKKTLWMIKKIIDNELPKLPTHMGEKEWLKEQGIKNGN